MAPILAFVMHPLVQYFHNLCELDRVLHQWDMVRIRLITRRNPFTYVIWDISSNCVTEGLQGSFDVAARTLICASEYPFV